ncbi:MAG: FecR domain-containing protein [Treponema sp.]|jgi:hypothetical protein|nr:FecR domain-containing protein [Treponema sp.]
MKKLILSVLLIFTVVFSVFSQTGTIRSLTGEVEIKPAGQSAFTAAREGTVVSRDTVISTGFRSTAIIAVGSTELVVRPLTRLTLAEIEQAAGTESLNVNLQTGRVRVDVTPPAGTRANTTVQTPSATASVRGTRINMGVDRVRVSSGKIMYSGNNGISRSVTRGFSSNTSGGKRGGGTTEPKGNASGGLFPNSPVGGFTNPDSPFRGLYDIDFVISVDLGPMSNY